MTFKITSGIHEGSDSSFHVHNVQVMLENTLEVPIDLNEKCPQQPHPFEHLAPSQSLFEEVGGTALLEKVYTWRQVRRLYGLTKLLLFLSLIPVCGRNAISYLPYPVSMLSPSGGLYPTRNYKVKRTPFPPSIFDHCVL